MSRYPAVISAADLFDIIGREDVKILDATFVLPNSGLDPLADYQKEHIEGAQFFDIKDFADTENPAPHMLCGPDCFAAKIGAMGIGNDDTVVIYGQSGMIMGPARAWWTFKTFGHEKVMVLDGGLPAWKRAGLSVTGDQPPAPENSSYTAHFQPALVRSMKDVEASMSAGRLILDARPAERFSGATPEPRGDMRAGHIPGSHNIPCSQIVDPQTGCMKSHDELEALFSICKSGEKACDITLSCGSGVTACALALALYSLGYENWSVYDGSWSEWGHKNAGTQIATQ